MIDRYLNEVSPEKAESSYESDLKRAKFLKISFGDMSPEDITPVHIYKYLDKRGLRGQVSADREFALLSHIFSFAIRWGVVTSNPCTHVRKFSEKRRSCNISDHEFNAILSIAQYPINYAMQLTYFMGLRPKEVLYLKIENISNEGFLIELTKTKHSVGKKLVLWTTQLRFLTDELIKLNKLKSKNGSLLCNKSGYNYTYDGFSTLWQKLMRKAVKEGIIQESFQFRDIRHKAATDIERFLGREAARQLLGHTSQNTTARYIDGIRVVKAIELRT